MQAEQVDVLVSDLARVHNGEITLVHECGDLLYKTHTSQVITKLLPFFLHVAALTARH